MWSAEITNDPTNDYDLYIELLENEVYKGRLTLNSTGQLVLTLYSSETHACIPVDWLEEIIGRAKKDLIK